jgi:hypothetical protein
MSSKSNAKHKAKREQVIRNLARKMQPPIGGTKPKGSREVRIKASLRGKFRRRCWKLEEAFAEIEAIAKDILEFNRDVAPLTTSPRAEDLMKAVEVFRSSITLPLRLSKPVRAEDEAEIFRKISEALGIE